VISPEKPAMSSSNNQKESSEFKYLVAPKRLLRSVLDRLANRKSLVLLIVSVSGSLVVLKKVDFRLKNLNFWAGFQALFPHICDLGFGLSLSNGC
jgi:hypothetical protein